MANNHLSRRRLLGILGSAGGALALAACSGAAPASPTAAPTVAAPTAAVATPTTATAAPNPTAQAVAPTSAQGELVLGAPLGITGPNAVEGKLTKNGYDLWAKTLNAAGGLKAGGKTYTVSIKYYDDASNADQSAQLTERLITQDGIKLLFGPYGSPVTFQATSVAEKYKAVMVEGNGAAEGIFNRGYKYVFGTMSPARQYGADA